MNFRHDDSSAGANPMICLAEKRSPQVLVVDDTASVREGIALLLRAGGYRVLEAKNGLAAQTMLQFEHPALVISDLEMPFCTGWDLLSHCHALYPDLPVLLMSGQCLGHRPEIERWAAGFFLKPFDSLQLCAEVQRLVPLDA